MSLVSFGLVACLLADLCFADKHHPIKFATAIIPPYQVLDENGILTGSSVRSIECAMTTLKQAYNVSVLPWVRAQKLVEQGEYDAFFIASENEVRNQYATLSAPLFDSSWIWFFPKLSTLDPNSVEFVQNASVGGVFGTNMHSWLKKDFKHVVFKTEADELFQLMSIARIDAVLLTQPMFKDSIKRLGLSENDFKRVVAKKRPLGVYFGNHFLEQDPKILTRFNQAIKGCL